MVTNAILDPIPEVQTRVEKEEKEREETRKREKNLVCETCHGESCPTCGRHLPLEIKEEKPSLGVKVLRMLA